MGGLGTAVFRKRTKLYSNFPNTRLFRNERFLQLTFNEFRPVCEKIGIPRLSTGTIYTCGGLEGVKHPDF